MAITTGSRVTVAVNYALAGQQFMNVYNYIVLELVGTPTAGDYAQAWWNHVKTNYRALCSAYFGDAFTSVRVTETGNSTTGEYGEYAVPVGERAGTRSYSSGEALPTFVAAGVRLIVATRSTRPGQKRFPFLMEADVNGAGLQSGYSTILATLMGTLTANMTLGAPAAGVVLVPSVVGLNADGTIRTSQVVTGYSINSNVTSQVSRKIGRGQ